MCAAQSPFITSPNGPDPAAFSSSYELGSIGPSKQTSLPIQNPDSFQRESSELRRMSTSQSEDMAPYALSFSSAGGDGHNMLRQSLEDAASVDSPRGSTASTPRMRSQKHLQSSHTRQRHAVSLLMFPAVARDSVSSQDKSHIEAFRYSMFVQRLLTLCSIRRGLAAYMGVKECLIRANVRTLKTLGDCLLLDTR